MQHVRIILAIRSQRQQGHVKVSFVMVKCARSYHCTCISPFTYHLLFLFYFISFVKKLFIYSNIQVITIVAYLIFFLFLFLNIPYLFFLFTYHASTLLHASLFTFFCHDSKKTLPVHNDVILTATTRWHHMSMLPSFCLSVSFLWCCQPSMCSSVCCIA